MKRLLADDPGFVEDSFWSDGMVRVSGREYNGLIDSPCFKDATDDETDDVVLLVPHDAQDTGRSAFDRGVGGHAPGVRRAWTATRPACSATRRCASQR